MEAWKRAEWLGKEEGPGEGAESGRWVEPIGMELGQTKGAWVKGWSQEWKFQKGAEPHKRREAVAAERSQEWTRRRCAPWRAPLTPVFPLTPPPETVRTATPFPMVSLFLVFTAFVISNIGHIRPQRTILAFVSGIFFILSGKPKERIYRLRDCFSFQEPLTPLSHKKAPSSLCDPGGVAEPL